MYLFFDTETTGLPQNFNAPASDLKNWPRMVQIAWILCNNEGTRITSNDYIIKPEGFIIPREATKVHGISTKRANDEGVELKHVLEEFNCLVEQTETIVAHNIRFDEKILAAEFIRKKIKSSFDKKPKICTMLASTKYCGLIGNYGYKWPKLTELHKVLFGKTFKEAHNAAADINATERCFWEMKKIGLV